MTLKAVFSGIQWANLATLVGGVLNSATNTVPALQTSKWFLLLQAALGIFLPSVGGFAHAIAHGEAQDPSDR